MADKDYSDDSISLSGFTTGVKKFLKILLGLDIFIINAIRSRLFVFVTTILIGFIVATTYYFIKPVKYTYSMIVEFNVLTRKTYYEIFNQLNSLTGTGAKDEVAHELGISDTSAAPIMYFVVENLNDQSLANDTSTLHRSSLKISMVTGKPELHLALLQGSILSYLNNRPFIKSAKEGERAIYTYKMLFIDTELKKLDSLKEFYNRFIATSRMASTVYNNAFNPADVYTRSSELMTQKTELTRWLSQEEKAVSLVDGFKAVGRPSSMSLTTSLIIASIITVPLAIIVCVLLAIRRRILI